MKSILIISLLFLCNLCFAQVGRIGINHSNPGVELDIRTFDTDDGSEINLGNADNSHYLRLFSGRDNFPSPIIFWKPGDPLVFATRTIGLPDFTEWMRIKSSGEVGIGVDNPINSLHIKGPKWAGISIEAGTYDPHIQLTSTTAGPLINHGEWTIRNHVDNDKSFEVNYNSGSGMTMDTLGNLGIKTDDPAATLDVNGSIRIGGLAVTNAPLISQVDGYLTSYNPVTAINASSFHCSVVSDDHPYISTGRFALGASNTSPSSCIEMVSPVQLFHGDVINAMNVKYYDQSSTKDLEFSLFHLDENGSSILLLEITPISNSSTFTVLNISDIFSAHTIDNQNYSYYITVKPVNSLGTPVTWDTSISIVSVHIQ